MTQVLNIVLVQGECLPPSEIALFALDTELHPTLVRVGLSEINGIDISMA